MTDINYIMLKSANIITLSVSCTAAQKYAVCFYWQKNCIYGQQLSGSVLLIGACCGMSS